MVLFFSYNKITKYGQVNTLSAVDDRILRYIIFTRTVGRYILPSIVKKIFVIALFLTTCHGEIRNKMFDELMRNNCHSENYAIERY